MFWFTIGFISLAFGAVGIILPLLPTTPFMLVAAFSLSRSSERWHKWLINHKIFGALIKNWQKYGAINGYAKIVSTVSIVIVFSLSIVMDVNKIVILIQFFVLGSVTIFILSRPLPPTDKKKL